MLRLIQLSDCHVTADPSRAYRGLDPRATLQAVLQQVSAWGPDLVLATGDLSEDASEASYRFLSEAFGQLEAPVWVTAGNHDEAAALASHFPRHSLDEPVLVHDGAWRVILLNSAKPGLIGGRIDERQRTALEALLRASGKPTVLALHHQPWPIGSPWIDRYALESPAPLLRAVQGRDRTVMIWGHVHQALSFERGSLTGLSAPSTVSNSLPEQPRFTLDPAGPACRWLELEDDGEFRTGLLHAGPASGFSIVTPDHSAGSTSHSTR